MAKTLLMIHVEFDIELPRTATKEQVTEWLKCYMGETDVIGASNPLKDHEPRAERGTLEWKAF